MPIIPTCFCPRLLPLLLLLLLTPEKVFSNHIIRSTISQGGQCGNCYWGGSSFIADCSTNSATMPMVNMYASQGCQNKNQCPGFDSITPSSRRAVDPATAWTTDAVYIPFNNNANQDTKCGNGYYMFGYRVPCGFFFVPFRTGSFPTSIICKKPDNLPTIWRTPPGISTVNNNPWGDKNADTMDCPDGTYLIGFGVTDQVRIDKIKLYCANPPDVSCPAPLDQNTSLTLPGGCSNIHQFCVVALTCKNSLYQPVAGTYAYAECTIQGTYNQTLLACVDVNECLQTPPVCTANSICQNQVGTQPGYSCPCKPGYKGGNNNCQDTNECSASCVNTVTDPIASACNNCTTNNLVCNNTQGGFTCSIPPNPCLQQCGGGVNNNCYTCSALATCNYTFPGPYACQCQLGYQTNDGGKTCTDFNECTTTFPCDLSTSTCTNFIGGYKCDCLSGYTQTGPTAPCTPVNECNNASICAGGVSSCQDTTPSYYCLPVISAVTKNKQPTPFILTNTQQTSIVDTLVITVKKETNCVAKDYLWFGSDNRYRTVGSCARNDNITLAQYTLNCTMPPGAGANLSFSLECCLSYTPSFPPTPSCVFSPPSSLLFSYPPPSLTPLSLTYAGSNDTIGVANIDAEATGTVVTMNGQNFFPSETQVFFGPINDPLVYACAVTTVTATTIMCIPQIVSGYNFSFTVIVGTGTAPQKSARGSDLLSFVGDPPVLSSLIGCTVGPTNNGVVQIADCPTQGGVLLQVYAKTAKNNNLRLPQLYVEGNRCIQIGNISSVGFNCSLPPGVGKSVMLELRDLKTSWFGTVLSYGSPSVTRISSPSCKNASSLSLINCANSSSLSIYIEGKNFGASGATVIINSVSFQAQHLPYIPGESPVGASGYHRFLVVNLNSSSSSVLALVNTIVVKQLDGDVSEGVGTGGSLPTFTLVPCLPGYARVGTGCTICSAGMYAYLEVCYNCTPGNAQAKAGQTSCIKCIPGYQASLPGQQNCSACGAGRYTTGQQCEVCPEGKYSTGAANSVCVACAPGSYNPSTNMSSCQDCTPGQYSVANAVVCEDCPEGRVSQVNRSPVCVACPRGTYQTDAGVTFCQDCGPGTYSPRSASPVCLACPAGTYHNLTRQSTCALCAVGSYQDTPGSIECIECDPGGFARSLASIVCEDCETGTFVNTSGASACIMCDPGYAQDVSGSTDCVACDPGFFSADKAEATCTECAPGFFQSASGASFCDLCPVGYYGNAKAAQDCTPCDPGTFQPGMAQQRCFSCSPGMYQPASASISCLACPAGTAATSESSLGCAACPAARFSKNQARVCLSCPPSSIQPLANQSSCIVCTSGSSPNELGTRCQCQVGYYSSYASSDNALTCPACPKGSGSCAQIGTQFTAITTLAGWWRKDNYSSTFYRCKTPLFCLGQDTCASFREGPMCALCIEGYRSSGVGGECAVCPATRATSWGYTVAICLLLLLLLVVMYYIALRVANAQQVRIFKLVEQMNKEAQENLAMTLRADDAHFEELRNEIHGGDTGSEDASVSDFETDERPVVVDKKPRAKIIAVDTSRRAPNFMYKVKILIGFFQIASYLPPQGDIAWPHAFVQFIGAFAFFNFDFIPWQTLSCATQINYFIKTIIVGFVPLIAILVLVVFFLISLCVSDYSTLEAQLEKGQRRNALWRQFVRLVLFTIFLLYPLVSKVAFGVYNCVTVEGVSYLVADFELHCYDEVWTTYAVIDGFFVALYPIGIPIVYFWILYSRQHRMREPETILVLGFLYEAYTDSAWYWELIDMTHKLILTSIIVFAPNEQRMAWNMAIMGIYLISLLLYSPYVRKGDDRFHLQVQATLFSIAFVGFILQDQNPYTTAFASPSQMEALVASLLITIVLVLLISFVVISGRNIRKIYLAHKKALKREKDTDNSSSPSQLSPFDTSTSPRLPASNQNKSATEREISSRSKSSEEKSLPNILF